MGRSSLRTASPPRQFTTAQHAICTSIPRASSSSAVPRVTRVSPAARLSSIPMVAGERTVVVPFQAKIRQRLTALLHMLAGVQLSYAIGVAKPLSLFVETYGTEQGELTA